MDLIEKYGNIVRNNMENPQMVFNLLKTGYKLERFRVSNFPDKQIPPSLQYLNKICLKFILEPLFYPQQSALVNLFAPTEFLHAINIYPQFVEAFSSFLSGTQCEDAFIDYAEKAGIGESVCSYHKAFLGAVEAKIIPKPKFSITTSIACDANLSTFRYAAQKYNTPFFLIDIPYELNEDSEQYVVTQLKDMKIMIEEAVGKKLEEDKLKAVIKLEQETKIYMKKYYTSLEKNYFPNTLTLEMYKLFASHVAIGREETYEFYRMQYQDIINSSPSSRKRILWIHLIPFYHEPLKQYFNVSDKYELLCCDLNYDYLGDLDFNKPYEAIAKKLILNHCNGSFQRKVDSILEMTDKLNVDAVINFCHWGCKQSSGGNFLLREAFKHKNIPYLSIDGDGIDRRNGHEEQIRTRLEAFLEILN